MPRRDNTHCESLRNAKDEYGKEVEGHGIAERFEELKSECKTLREQFRKEPRKFVGDLKACDRSLAEYEQFMRAVKGLADAHEHQCNDGKKKQDYCRNLEHAMEAWASEINKYRTFITIGRQWKKYDDIIDGTKQAYDKYCQTGQKK